MYSLDSANHNQHTPAHTDILGAVSKNQSTAAVHPLLPTVAVTNGSPTPGVEHMDDWDTEDTASMSDTASVSSGCSSVGSQGKSAVVCLCVGYLKRETLWVLPHTDVQQWLHMSTFSSIDNNCFHCNENA